MDIEDLGTDADWKTMTLLAGVASLFAAAAAALLHGHIPDTTIIVCIIVAATMASWFQLEHPTHRSS